MSAEFHPGKAIARRHTKKERGVKRRKGGGTFSPRTKSWLILPAHMFSTRVYFNLLFSGPSFQAVLASLEGKRTEHLPDPFGVTEEEMDECLLLAAKCQRVRVALATFARRWLLVRRVKVMNEEDIVTCEVPRQPVQILDWSQRKLYVYEAATIARDIRESLLQQDYLFPAPKPPRNILTNEPLSLQQFLSVVDQLREYRKLHWATEALCQYGYNMAQFTARFDQPLRLETLANVFARPTSETVVELVYQFIEDEHEYHGVHLNKALYIWAVRNAPYAETIKAWRRLTYRFHELDIQIIDKVECHDQQYSELSERSRALCLNIAELLALRKQMLHGLMFPSP